MNKKTSAIVVFVLLCAACVAHAFYYYPRLPIEVARHFGASGRPDAWDSKKVPLIVYLSTVAIMGVTFLGIGLAMPKLPNSIINLPNADYWLAPERRQRTLDYMLCRFLWLGSITMILLFYVFHQMFRVQLGKAAKLNHIWLSMGAYMAVVAVWCIAIYLKFRKKGSQLPTESTP